MVVSRLSRSPDSHITILRANSHATYGSRRSAICNSSLTHDGAKCRARRLHKAFRHVQSAITLYERKLIFEGTHALESAPLSTRNAGRKGDERALHALE